MKPRSIPPPAALLPSPVFQNDSTSLSSPKRKHEADPEEVTSQAKSNRRSSENRGRLLANGLESSPGQATDAMRDTSSPRRKLRASTERKRTASIPAQASAAEVPYVPTITSGERSTLCGKEGDPKVNIAHVTHQPDQMMKQKMAGKFIKLAATTAKDEQHFTFEPHREHEQKAGPDLVAIKKMLMENDLVLLEVNLGKLGQNDFPFPDDFFRGTRACVLPFCGGDYPKVVEGLEKAKKYMGDRLLSTTPFRHEKMNGRGAFDSDFIPLLNKGMAQAAQERQKANRLAAGAAKAGEDTAMLSPDPSKIPLPESPRGIKAPQHPAREVSFQPPAFQPGHGRHRSIEEAMGRVTPARSRQSRPVSLDMGRINLQSSPLAHEIPLPDSPAPVTPQRARHLAGTRLGNYSPEVSSPGLPDYTLSTLPDEAVLSPHGSPEGASLPLAASIALPASPLLETFAEPVPKTPSN